MFVRIFNYMLRRSIEKEYQSISLEKIITVRWESIWKWKRSPIENIFVLYNKNIKQNFKDRYYNRWTIEIRLPNRGIITKFSFSPNHAIRVRKVSHNSLSSLFGIYSKFLCLDEKKTSCHNLVKKILYKKPLNILGFFYGRVRICREMDSHFITFLILNMGLLISSWVTWQLTADIEAQ